MTDFYSQNRCVCSTRSHGPLLCAFCLSFHFNNHCGKKNYIHDYSKINHFSKFDFCMIDRRLQREMSQ